MEVLNVSWDSIPKQDHNHILSTIPKGTSIASLPFATTDSQTVVRIPVRGNLKVNMAYDPSDPNVCEIKTLTFYRVFARKSTGEPCFVWRKGQDN